MGTIDLDAIAAARREGKNEKPNVKFGGVDFELPPEMPFAVVEAVGRMQGVEGDNSQVADAMADLAKSLFGPRFREFLDLGPSVQDITALLEAIAPAYGVSPGESPASE
jgi:hypothetical protein